jgi:hypothetical protein
VQVPIDVRQLVAALVEDAQRIPAPPPPPSPAPSSTAASTTGVDSISLTGEDAEEDRRREKEERRARREARRRRKEAELIEAEKARASQEAREERERAIRQEKADMEERLRREADRKAREKDEARAAQEAAAAEERRRQAEAAVQEEHDAARRSERDAAIREAHKREKEEARAKLEAEAKATQEAAAREKERKAERREARANRKAAEAVAAAAAAVAAAAAAVAAAPATPATTPAEPAAAVPALAAPQDQPATPAAAGSSPRRAGPSPALSPRLAPAAAPTPAPPPPPTRTSLPTPRTPPAATPAASQGPALTSHPVSDPRSGGRSDGTPASASPAAAAAAATTAFREFNLTPVRTYPKRQGTKPSPGDAIRRLPALVTLHYELSNQQGVVARSVGWQARPEPRRAPGGGLRRALGRLAGGQKQSPGGSSGSGALPAPAGLAEFAPQSMDEVAAYVAQHGGLPLSPGRDPAAGSPGAGAAAADYGTDRWSTLRHAVALRQALGAMAEELAEWVVDAAAGPVAEAHRLADYMADVAAAAGQVTNAHDPLRARMARHGVPWDEGAVGEARWGAQRAAAALMRLALDCAAEGERAKGLSWQRQAVLQPLGHAVMGVFPVHQFAGGFNAATAALGERLVERTVHFARSIDPKWWRDTKVAG